MSKNDDSMFSTLGLFFTFIFCGMAMIVIAFFVNDTLEEVNWEGCIFLCLLVFLGFIVAISPNFLFFSILDFILISFVLVTMNEASFMSILVIWLISILLMAFFSTFSCQNKSYWKPSLKARIKYIPEGYEKIHKEAKIAWIEFLGGTIKDECRGDGVRG